MPKGLISAIFTQCWRKLEILLTLLLALTVITIASLLAVPQRSAARTIRSTLGATSVPPALVCPPHVAWNWQYTTGTGISNSYGYLLRMALMENGTGEVVYAIQQTSPPQASGH